MSERRAVTGAGGGRADDGYPMASDLRVKGFDWTRVVDIEIRIDGEVARNCVAYDVRQGWTETYTDIAKGELVRRYGRVDVGRRRAAA